MRAAVYARKSTEQVGRADEHKSVTRQIELAHAFAAVKGWTVVDVYSDDGVSGAEFARRPGLQSMLQAARCSAFSVLIVSEQKSLGRESFETNFLIKQLAQSGIEIVEYVHGRSLTPRTWIEKATSAILASADEAHREQTRERVHEAHLRLARQGAVVGGRCFGYRNITISKGIDAHGRPLRSHVERQIHDEEAAVVRRIFELAVSGVGFSKTAKLLNSEDAVCPRPQHARPAGWSPSTVREVLHRELYRGVLVWNRSRKRDDWGQKKQRRRPESEWERVEIPSLRIVSDDVWHAAHHRLANIRAHLRAAIPGGVARHRDVESVHLLAGFARCGCCGASFYPLSRDHGSSRAFFYGCSANHKRGKAVCANGHVMRKERIEDAVLAELVKAFRPAVVDAVLEGVLAAMVLEVTGPALDNARAELVSIEHEIARLIDALALGGDIPAAVAAVKARQARQQELQRVLAEATRIRPRINPRQVKHDARALLTHWRALLTTKHVQDGRQLLREALVGPIRFTPEQNGTLMYRFEGDVAMGRLLMGVASLAPFVASPAGFEPALPA
jgi:site-specific DNA recombinase